MEIFVFKSEKKNSSKYFKADIPHNFLELDQFFLSVDHEAIQAPWTVELEVWGLRKKLTVNKCSMKETSGFICN